MEPTKIDLDKFHEKFRLRFDELIHFVPVPLCIHYYQGEEHILSQLETFKFQRRLQILSGGETHDQPLEVFLKKAQAMICQMEVGAFAFQGKPIISGIPTDDRVTQGEHRLIVKAQAETVSSAIIQLANVGYTLEVLDQLSRRLENQQNQPCLRNFDLPVDETKK